MCETTYVAPLPESVCASKYDPSCASLLAQLRRCRSIASKCCRRASTCRCRIRRWDILSQAVPAPRAVFDELIREAGQADLLHCDDTPMKILSLIAERKQIEAASLEAKRKAINTSSIVAVLDEGKHVALYFTGHPHAGQNLSAVLAKREPGLAIPMQMSDALASNFVGEFATIIGKCIAHGRRRFVDLVPHFPEHCRYVIETLAQVYAHEAHCQAKAMSPDERLLYHQEHSGPPMQAMRDWIGDQFAKSLVEPHSSLGKALTYLSKHWDGMTLFLRHCRRAWTTVRAERALKRAIMHRKNSMFYKTPKGAERLHEPDPYVRALSGQSVRLSAGLDVSQVLAQAAQWLPWNYHKQLAAT
jgi:transposase